MRNLKRIFCLAMALVMCLGLLPTVGMAAVAAPYEGAHDGTVAVTVRDAFSNAPVQNVFVKLEDITAGRGSDLGSFPTSKSGSVEWPNLSDGWYRATIVGAPTGYMTDTVSETRECYFAGSANKTLAIDLTIRPLQTLHVYHYDPDLQANISGAHYRILNSAGEEVYSGETDETGVLVVPYLLPGDYEVVEDRVPPGYNVSSPNIQRATISAASNVPAIVTFAGYELSTITIFNFDGNTGSPIANSTWRITRTDGTVVYDYRKTNSNGLVTVTDVLPGTYQITQLEVGTGYIRELNHGQITIGRETQHPTVSFSNIKPGTIKVYVGDSVTHKNLAGCTFYLYDEHGKIVDGPKNSGSDGMVTFKDVPDGNYSVKADAPSGYVMDVANRAATVKNGSTEFLQFSATPLGSILITAVDANTRKNIPGCTFEVRNQSGTFVAEFTTGSDGTVSVPHLENGSYTIVEKNVPAGYVIESATQTVYVRAGEVTPANFLHRDKPYIVVQCYVKGTTTPIPGSVVSLCNDNGVSIRTGTIGSDGTYTFEDLEPGTYTVKYVSAPDGYSIDSSSQTVVVTKAKAGLATLFASRHSAIVISKQDAVTKQPLAGTTFVIRNRLGEIAERVVTDATGTAVSKLLSPGRYTVHEQFATDNYVPTTVFQNVDVKNNETSLLSFTNKQESAIVVYAYDKDGIPVPNVSYIVYDVVSGQEVVTQLTDAAGVAVFEQLEPGLYMVSESVVPDGYIVVDPTQARVVLNAGEPTYLRFVHVPEAVIKMETADIQTGKPVTGAVYKVESRDGSFEANYETDANGEAWTDSLPLGTYEVKQIQAPDGYLLNTTTQTVTVYRDRVNLAKFFNRQMSCIVVECVESGSNFGLAGATITVEDEAAKEVAHGTTTTGGIFTTGELDPGKYLVKVIANPDGYACVQEQRTVEVTTGLATSVKFEFTAFNHIIINLTDASQPGKGLGNSKFRIETIDGNFVADLVTDSAGHAKSDALPNGKYMVHQTVAPEGYILDQSYQWATLDATADTVMDFTNRRISGLTIQALTEVGHEGLAGATFEVWEQNGKLVKTVTTDATGVVTIDGLTSGIYLIKEVVVPKGYTARTATQTVTVNYEEPTTVNFYHTSESILTINKTDQNTGKPLAGASFRITKANGDYVGDYTTDASGKIIVSTLAAGTYHIAETKAPQGYVLDPTSRSFTIKDNQPVVLDIPNAPVAGFRIINTCKQDGSPIQGSVFKICTYDGKYVGSYTTDTAGLINVTLASGKYTIYQVSVPDGFVRNEKVWNITVVDGKNEVLEVQNERLSRVIIHMIDASTKKPVYGVEVELKDSKNNYIGRFKSDNEGNIFFTDVMSAGRYVLSLWSVPDGYDKDSVPKTVEVKTGEITEITWELQGHQGQVTIVTYAGQDNKMMNIRKNTVLAGAVYQITDGSGKVLGTITGDVNGQARSGVLPIGTYYFQQIAAPSGWQLNGSKFSVNVSKTNDNIRVEVYNLAANYATKISVGGTATARAGDSVKYYFNVQNDSTSAMDSFFIHIKVPTDGLRAKTLYTGTYSGAATTFNVEYKTNMSEYRQLAVGLNSKSSYSYGLSTQALGLQNGEYVTDVRMVFSTVVAGFKTQTAATLDCYVLSTIPTGYQAVMRAECGAMMNGYFSNTSNGGQWGSSTGQSQTQNPGVPVDSGWVSAANQYTTYCYGFAQNVLPGSLPKTGY